jgi:hypothetical protein
MDAFSRRCRILVDWYVTVNNPPDPSRGAAGEGYVAGSARRWTIRLARRPASAAAK